MRKRQKLNLFLLFIFLMPFVQAIDIDCGSKYEFQYISENNTIKNQTFYCQPLNGSKDVYSSLECGDINIPQCPTLPSIPSCPTLPPIPSCPECKECPQLVYEEQTDYFSIIAYIILFLIILVLIFKNIIFKNPFKDLNKGSENQKEIKNPKATEDLPLPEDILKFNSLQEELDYYKDYYKNKNKGGS